LFTSNDYTHRQTDGQMDRRTDTHMNTRLGDGNFAVAGPRLWNTLPVELRQPDVELVTFRRLLVKTHLFKCYPGA